MRAERAAAYLSISKSMFLKLVAEGRIGPPTKIPGHDVTTWDRLDLDSAYEDWKSDSGPNENTVLKRLRELRDEREGPPLKSERKKPWSSRDSVSYRDLKAKTPTKRPNPWVDDDRPT
jgi:hypothetical protein